APAQVRTLGHARDLLPVPLAHVTQPDLAGHWVKGPSIGVAGTVCPDLGTPAGDGEGVGCRDRVVAGGVVRESVAVYVEAQEFTVQGVEVLGAVLGIALRGATVAGAYHEIAVLVKVDGA